MTPIEAFQILKIDSDSSKKEIKNAYRKYSKKFHPDVSSEIDERQIKLNEAKEIALAYEKVKYSIITVKESRDLITKINRDLERNERKSKTDSYLKKVTSQKTIKVRQTKYIIWSLTAVLAFITFAGTEYLTIFNTSSEIESYLKIFFIITGGLSLFFQFAQENIKNQIDIINDHFQDKQNCVLELSRLLNYKPIKSFNTDELNAMISENHSSLNPISLVLGKIEISERLKILVLKAKENELIEQKDADIIKPQNFNKYYLKFNPSDFGSTRERKNKPTEPRTINEIKNDIKTSLIVSIVFTIGTASIIYFFSSFWAILTGIISFFGIGGILVDYSELRKMKKAKNVSS